MINRKEALNIDFPEAIEPIPKEGWTQTTRHYKVITPLWGGGVKPNENDPITLIRGSSIRGHLRFWWRAMRGNSNGSSLAAMRTRENEIWGSTQSPSQVKISVQEINKGRLFQPENSILDSISYATFPVRLNGNDNREGIPFATLKEKVEFNLELEYPKSLEKEVEAALWAWQTFGGVGARTRRGMGAIECAKINGKSQERVSRAVYVGYIEKMLKSWIQKGDFPVGVPHLSVKPKFKLTGGQAEITGIAALGKIIKQYKIFRQNKSLKKLSKEPQKFFRLPESIPDTNIVNQGDITRLGSPLILHPVHFTEGFAAMALMLEWEPLKSESNPLTKFIDSIK